MPTLEFSLFIILTSVVGIFVGGTIEVYAANGQLLLIKNQTKTHPLCSIILTSVVAIFVGGTIEVYAANGQLLLIKNQTKTHPLCSSIYSWPHPYIPCNEYDGQEPCYNNWEPSGPDECCDNTYKAPSFCKS
jgi:hypothetical protein